MPPSPPPPLTSPPSDDPYAGLSSKEIYKLKLKEIKAKEAAEKVLEEAERAKREAEEAAIREEKERLLAEQARKDERQGTRQKKGKKNPFGSFSSKKEIDPPTGADPSNKDEGASVHSSEKSRTPTGADGMAQLVNRLATASRGKMITEVKEAVVVTQHDRELLNRQDRDLINDILAKAERERVRDELRRYASPQRTERTVPSSPREGLSGCSSLDTIDREKHASYYRGLSSPPRSPRSKEGLMSPPKDRSARGTSPSAIPSSRSPYMDEFLQKEAKSGPRSSSRSKRGSPKKSSPKSKAKAKKPDKSK